MADGINYDGPDPSVECAYPPCKNRLRRSDFGGDQWCTKAHREATLAEQVWCPSCGDESPRSQPHTCPPGTEPYEEGDR